MANAEYPDRFVAWARETAESIRPEGISAEVEVCSPTSNSAANLHVDSGGVLARITCWTDGSYHAEALDTGTGNTVFSHHAQLIEAARLSAEFEEFFELVRIRSAQPDQADDRD